MNKYITYTNAYIVAEFKIPNHPNHKKNNVIIDSKNISLYTDIFKILDKYNSEIVT